MPPSFKPKTVSCVNIPVEVQHDVSMRALEGPIALFVNVQCDGSEAARSRKMQGFVAVSS